MWIDRVIEKTKMVVFASQGRRYVYYLEMHIRANSLILTLTQTLALETFEPKISSQQYSIEDYCCAKFLIRGTHTHTCTRTHIMTN